MQEADARMVIDRKLREAGRDIENKLQVSSEVTIEGKRADYVLRDHSWRELAVIEAKTNTIDPYTAKQQAEWYAQWMKVNFVFLANDSKIYFRDITSEDAREVQGFFSQEDLERLQSKHLYLKPLSDIPFDEEIAGRPYQIDCCKTIDQAILQKKRKILIEMATGTGKTRTIASEIQRLIKSWLANKVLFLVDREALATQTHGTFQKFLPEYGSYIYHENVSREWKTITIATLQTMQNHFGRFSTGYFDVIIVDECHRSIYGEWRKTLDHFDAIKIGLTATPSFAIDKNTFLFFETKAPHFVYSMRQAIKDKHLADYEIYAAKTDIDLNGVVDTETWETYLPQDLERRVTVPDRNREIVADYKAHSKAEQKSIWFAVNQAHAGTLTRMLNEAYPDYKGKYAELIDYTVDNAADIIKRFKRDELPKALVSVDMLTTWFDAPEVENLVLIRPTKSPILYQQIRGRWTRLAYDKDGNITKDKFMVFDYVGVYDYFKSLWFEDKDNVLSDEDLKNLLAKKLRLVAESQDGKWWETEWWGSDEIKVIDEQAHIVIRERIELGTGEKVDVREYKDEFEHVVMSKAQELAILQEIKDGNYTEPVHIEHDALQTIQSKLLTEQSSERYALEHLREAYQQPKAGFFDFIKVALWLTKFPTREEKINEIFDGRIATQNLNEKQLTFLNVLKAQIIANNKQLHLEDLLKPPYTAHGGYNKAMELFGDEIVEKIQELNTICFV